MVVRRLVSLATERQVKYVRPVPPGPAAPLLGQVYTQVEQDMRVVSPPFLLHSPAPQALAGCWLLFRETMLVTGATSRLEREAVAAAVSVANSCPYCVDLHTASMYELADPDEAEAVAEDRLDRLVDPVVRDVAAWARQAHHPGQPALAVSPAATAELIGVVVTFHYLTRMVNAFLVNPLLPDRLRGASRRRVKQGMSHLLRPMLRRGREPAASLHLLPAQPVPPDARWAEGSPAVAGAVARAAAAFEAAGSRVLAEPVRDLVAARLDTWRGEAMGLSRAWVDEAVASLPDPERPAARLALLTALASHQINGSVISDFRRSGHDDGALIAAAAWASFAAARRVGDRLAPAAGRPRPGGPEHGQADPP